MAGTRRVDGDLLAAVVDVHLPARDRRAHRLAEASPLRIRLSQIAFVPADTFSGRTYLIAMFMLSPFKDAILSSALNPTATV